MDIRRDMPLGEMNTLKVKAHAKYFVEIENINKLKEAVYFAKENKLEILVLGEGSNICFLEEFINKLVVKLNIKDFQKKGDTLIAGAGYNWDLFVQKAISEGVPYIENLSGIPGTVGAAPIQNIGAYGVEVKDIISWVEVFDLRKGVILKFKKENCNFSYRNSIFKRPNGKNYIVTRVAFRTSDFENVNLEYKDLAEYFGDLKPDKRQIRDAVLEVRSRKFPDLDKFGTAGSFFKNPIIDINKYINLKREYPEIPKYNISDEKVKVPLAWILDKVCNLKGYRKGNVWLHKDQPLVLVTNGLASSEEIKNFSKEIKEIVFDKTKIIIENEVVFKK